MERLRGIRSAMGRRTTTTHLMAILCFLLAVVPTGFCRPGGLRAVNLACGVATAVPVLFAADAGGAAPTMATVPHRSPVCGEAVTGAAKIARALTIAEQTAESHVSRVLTKLGLRDRAEAEVPAYECGLVVPAE